MASVALKKMNSRRDSLRHDIFRIQGSTVLVDIKRFLHHHTHCIQQKGPWPTFLLVPLKQHVIICENRAATYESGQGRKLYHNSNFVHNCWNPDFMLVSFTSSASLALIPLPG